MYAVSVNNWENPAAYETDIECKAGDVVVIKTTQGNCLGTVFGEISEGDVQGKIVRKATARDREVEAEHEKQRPRQMSVCRQEIKRLGIEMKLVDAVTSLDGARVTFLFTAEGRIDFRELVKNLLHIFKKSIRMQQIGSRDEARRFGGYGICGRECCCVKTPGSLRSISTDMARSQLIVSRGSERISGLCGRLMCCLAFEEEQYQQMLEAYPAIGTEVKTKAGKGAVTEVNVIKGEYKVKLEDGNIVTFKHMV